VIGQLVLVQVELLSCLLLFYAVIGQLPLTLIGQFLSTVIGAFRSSLDAESSQLTKFRAYAGSIFAAVECAEKILIFAVLK